MCYEVIKNCILRGGEGVFFLVTVTVILGFWTFDMIAVIRYTYDMAMMD